MSIIRRIHKYWFGTNAETQAALKVLKTGKIAYQEVYCGDIRCRVNRSIEFSIENIFPIWWSVEVCIDTHGGQVCLPITWRERKEIFSLLRQIKKQHRQNQLDDVALQLDLD